MSSKHTSLVWNNSAAKGAQKLVLLALADNADQHGDVAIPLRRIGDLCGMAKSSVEAAIAALISSDELEVLSQGSGHKSPAKYRVKVSEGVGTGPVINQAEFVRTKDAISEPDRADSRPAEKEPARQESVSFHHHEEVVAVLLAADISNNEASSPYWKNPAHKDDLKRLLDRTGRNMPNLLTSLNLAVEAGATLSRPARRITDLAALLEQESGRR